MNLEATLGISVEERSDIVNKMASYYKEILRLGQSIGIENVLEKAKLKEVIMGDVLNHRVYTKSTGEKKGVDAVDESTGELYEYKTSTLKNEKETKRFLESIVDGTKTYQKTMVYNNGYSRENVDEYKNINHLHAMFSHDGTLLSIVHVETDFVVESLMVRVENIENGNKKYKSTNGNSVTVRYQNGGAKESKVLYLNDTRK